MPTCTVDRKSVEWLFNSKARCARTSPASLHCWSRMVRAATSAISAIANTPLATRSRKRTASSKVIAMVRPAGASARSHRASGQGIVVCDRSLEEDRQAFEAGGCVRRRPHADLAGATERPVFDLVQPVTVEEYLEGGPAYVDAELAPCARGLFGAATPARGAAARREPGPTPLLHFVGNHTTIAVET